MKKCTTCKESKILESFSKDKSHKDGYRSVCKLCSSIQKKAAYKIKQHTLEIKVTIKFCPTCNNTKESNLFDRDKRKEDGLAWECKECRSIRNKKMYELNKEVRKKKSNEYWRNNKEKANKSRMMYQNKREKTDILYRLARRLRNRLYYALKRASWKKGVKFNDYIGCSLEELKTHLEAKFTDGMSWENWGLGDGFWAIDHIIPLVSAKTEDEMTALCHFTNLQPMWCLDNIRKGGKV